VVETSQAVIKAVEGKNCFLSMSDTVREVIMLFGFDLEEVSTLTKNILEGLKFLDEKYGSEWVNWIDLEYLDMQSSRRDILGQIEGYWWFTLDKFGLTFDDAISLGFALPVGSEKSKYEVLTELWRAIIAKRRAE
jgi:hypothetical protein